jgi:hypothetical protein
VKQEQEIPTPDFLKRFSARPNEPIPLVEAIASLSCYCLAQNRKLWDQNSPRVGRAWYLLRERGLLAYSRHEAKLMLKPFARNNCLSADDYCAAVIRDKIRESGADSISEATFELFEWPDFMEWKRQHDPKFFQRLGQWQFKGRELDDNRPDIRLKLYGSLYDRCVPSPLEFCTDGYAAWVINSVLQNPEWPAGRVKTNEQAVRGWRRLLGLQLSRPLVARLGESAGRTIRFDEVAAAKHGIPRQN